MNQAIYNFYWDCGRQGSLKGWFLAQPEQIKAVLGMRVYFGEVLGKHSEIYGNLKEADFTLLSSEPEDIAAFQRVLVLTGTSLGWNPFKYLELNCTSCDAEGSFETMDQILLCCGEKYCQKCAPSHKEKYHQD